MSLKRQGHCHVDVRAENPDLASQIDRHDVYTRLVSCSTPLAGHRSSVRFAPCCIR